MNRFLRSTWIALTLVGVGAACRHGASPSVAYAESAKPARPSGGAAREPSTAHTESTKPARPVVPPKAGERKAKGAEARPSDSAAAKRDDAASGACPSGMVLVEGDYCSKVDHDCEKSWYDESNKKTVCERFAAKARCIGDKTQ